jgi:hypothetical protein
VPSALGENFDDALCILDDGLQSVLPTIERAVPKYAPTVDINIASDTWHTIIRDWEVLLSQLEVELPSPDPFDYPPYSTGRWLMLHLKDASLSREDGLKQYRCFVREIIGYLENHLASSSHITLTGL